ncbi:probable receptor-like protein kinase At3g17420 [Andrographis paniculata]|uniref:probable receptor-like protein kinase At3g17420 n=1 Tax=Andrographis paniculata TaxID=175694 RepID=UPI0021E75F3B|nr:probable receptor-like protein kinase At3g17420 [Andrographis paniculata]
MEAGGCIKVWAPSLFFIALSCLEAFPFSFPSSSAAAAAAASGDCSLDFSTYPYKPIGGCDQVHEKLQDWRGFPKTRCCQNALVVFSNALAVHARKSLFGNIFLDPDGWNDCSRPFGRQPNMSVQSCGFDGFFYGSGKCTSLQLDEINQSVAARCSSFGTSSFDDVCEGCLSAISNALGKMVADVKVKGNHTEKALCLVSIIVSVIAGNGNNTSQIDEFNRCLPALAAPELKNHIKIRKSAARALLSAIFVMAGLIVVIALIRSVTNTTKSAKKPLLNKDIKDPCSGLYWFSKAEIEKAIDYSNERKYLGKGSAGQVFKGMLPSGQPVAIKQVYKNNTSDSFTREIEGLSRVRHPNLVNLFGCCVEDGEQYLVYEYCPNGNLAQHILGKDAVIPWETRVKILRNCAFSLKHLHNHIDGCLVHRDIKLTNILLTRDMDPKLSDFGLAKMLGMEESRVYTNVRGTIGYMDPEYMVSGKLTSASDIYSFGIVILQLLSGYALDLDLDARDDLIQKAKEVNMGKLPLIDFQDPRLKGEVICVDFESILQIAVLCVASSSSGRPTIELVCQELEKARKNTQKEMRARKERGLVATTPSKSPELIQV